MTDKHLIETMKICCAGACDYWSCNYDFDKHPECMESLLQDALELIQRQQERIERLKDNLDAVLSERATLDVDRVVAELEAEKYKGMEGLEPIKVAFNFGINKALDLLKGVQNESAE